MQNYPPDVPVAIARETSAPSLDRVHRLCATGEPEVLDRFDNQAGSFVQPVFTLVGADDDRVVDAELDIAATGDAHRFLGIGSSSPEQRG